MEKHLIYADIVKNRLYLTLNGFMTDDEIHVAAEKTVAEIQKLKPGFSIINDISSFKPATPASVEEIKRVQVFAKERGAGRIIRVVGKEALASMQFARSSKGAGYDADMAASVQDAEKLLGD